MNQRKNKFLTTSLIFIAILVVITIILNFIVGRLPISAARIDCTENQEYTLTDSTKKIMGKVTDTVTVTYWVSEEMPSTLASLRQDVIDFLTEIQYLGEGNIELKVLDPEKEAERLAAEAKAEKERRKKDLAASDFKEEEEEPDFSNPFMGPQPKKTEKEKQLDKFAQRGIRQNVERVIKKDKAEAAAYYSAIEISYKGKNSEVIPNVNREMFQNLEYEVTSRVLKLTMDEKDKPVVAFFNGQPEMQQMPPNPMNPNMPPMPQKKPEYTLLKGKQVLAEFFTIKDTDITKDDPIPSDAEILIIAEPKNMNERQAYEINKFVSTGGKAIFMVGAYNASLEAPPQRPGMPPMPPMPEKIRTGLENVFREWGIRINPLPLNSTDSGVDTIQQSPDLRSRQMIPLPTHAVSRPENFNPDSPFLHNVSMLVFPWSTTFTIDSKELLEKKNLESDVLATSSKETWFGKKDFRMINDIFENGPKNKEEAENFDWADKQDLLVMMRGKFPFRWEGKPVPEWPEEASSADNNPDGDNDDAEKKEEKKPQTGHIEQPADSSILLVGSPEFCKDDYYQKHMQYIRLLTRNEYYIPNFFLLRNVVEVYSLSDDLLKIRAKQSSRRPFDPDIEGGTTTFLKWINLLGIPLLVAAAGLFYAFLRTKGSSAYTRRASTTSNDKA